MKRARAIVFDALRGMAVTSRWGVGAVPCAEDVPSVLCRFANARNDHPEHGENEEANEEGPPHGGGL